MANILVEGWRFLAHSYAVVNQFQCLEMLKRPVKLFHRDVPFYMPAWKPVNGLFDAEQETALRSIKSPPSSPVADAVFRIAFPYDLKSSTARTVVFATSEYQSIPDICITSHQSFKDAYRESDSTIVTPSNWSRAGFLREGASEERVVVVPHGVDTSLFRPVNRSRKNGLRRGLGWEGFVFLHIGAMTRNKGMDLLLKAFAGIIDSYPQARLVLKGSDALYSSRQNILHTFQNLSAGEQQKILPRLSYLGETLPFVKCAELYQAADVYISPYRAEGFNLPVLEAVACGLPVICTRGGPTDDFTQPDFTLYVESTLHTFEKDQSQQWMLEPDVEHLAVRMREVIEQKEWNMRAHHMGPDFVARRFTWKKVVDQLTSVLGV